MRPFSLMIVLVLPGSPSLVQAPPDPVARVPAILREELATQPVASLSVVILHPQLTQVAGMSERITAGLRPHSQPMRFTANLDLVDGTRGRVESVDQIVEAA